MIFALSSPLSSPLFVSGHLLSDQLNKMFIVFCVLHSPVPKLRVQILSQEDFGHVLGNASRFSSTHVNLLSTALKKK